MLIKSIKDITGKKFNMLKVLEISDERDRDGCVMWVCKCDCGSKALISGVRLRNGQTKSCGCLKIRAIMERSHKDLTGKKFGKLKVLSKSNKLSKRGVYWDCVCECGKEHQVSGDNLRSGGVKSCGCSRVETLSKMRGENSPHYKKSLTEEDRVAGRFNLGYYGLNDWRTAVYEKCNYTCVICDERGGQLNAHHMDGWNWCKEKRFDVNNGVTLCKGCHNAFHNAYGRGDNTKEQFEEFYTKNKAGSKKE